MRNSTDLHEQILEHIDKLLTPSLIYEILQLKTNTSINLISRIVNESNKTIHEAVSVFLAVVKFLWKDDNTSSFQEFIKDNAELICKMAIEKKAQRNLPNRALPLFEILERKIPASSISVIELGASYGLIGRCLLNPAKIKEKKDAYFPSDQQMPRNTQPINYYLGIDISLPTKEWLLAWEWNPVQKKRLENFLDTIPVNTKENKTLKLQKGDAFGFSSLEAVKNLAVHSSTIVVLTAYMLYQYDDKKQKRLRNEILEFTNRCTGHWINQTFDESSLECFIEFDGEKIIKLADDTCSSWKWLK